MGGEGDIAADRRGHAHDIAGRGGDRADGECAARVGDVDVAGADIADGEVGHVDVQVHPVVRVDGEAGDRDVGVSVDRLGNSSVGDQNKRGDLAIVEGDVVHRDGARVGGPDLEASGSDAVELGVGEIQCSAAPAESDGGVGTRGRECSHTAGGGDGRVDGHAVGTERDVISV